MIQNKKSVHEMWPDDDLSPEFIHNQILNIESFNNNNFQENNKKADCIKPKKPLKKVKLQKFKSTDYVFQSVNNESTLPYNFPQTKQIHKEIFQYDQRNVQVPIARYQQEGVKQTPKKLKRIVNDGFHEEQLQDFHLTPVRDSVAARSFKCYLKNQGIRAMDLLEEVPFDEYSLNSSLDLNSAPSLK